MSARATAYIICTTPRTGSTLLCSLLEATNVAGRPESYFRAQDIDARVDRWQVRQADGTFRYEDFLSRVLERGSTPNGVFAARIMWGTLEEVVCDLRACGLTGSDTEVLTAAFGPTKFIYLQRENTIAQAISRARAEQTNVWHITRETDGQNNEKEAHYDRGAIQRFVEESVEHNRAWQAWFAKHGVKPMNITYEALDLDGDAVARSVLDFIGVEAPLTPIRAGNVRMADQTSREWEARFRSESGTAGSRREGSAQSPRPSE